MPRVTDSPSMTMGTKDVTHYKLLYAFEVVSLREKEVTACSAMTIRVL